VLAVETTQWVIAIGSLGSALVALALALGLKDWFFRPRLRLVLRHASDPEESSDRIVTKRLETAETAAFVRLRLDNRGRSTARNVGVRVLKVGTRRAAAGSVLGQSSMDDCCSREPPPQESAQNTCSPACSRRRVIARGPSSPRFRSVVSRIAGSPSAGATSACPYESPMWRQRPRRRP
jgi:hypothetical protein